MTAERDRVALRPEQATIPPGHPWNRLPVIAAACALLGGVACAILGAANPRQFFFSWLVSFLFCLSLALGGVFFLLVQYSAPGGWGVVVWGDRRNCFCHDSRDGGSLPAGGPRSARSLRVVARRGCRQRSAPPLEGAIPQC